MNRLILYYIGIVLLGFSVGISFGVFSPSFSYQKMVYGLPFLILVGVGLVIASRYPNKENKDK